MLEHFRQDLLILQQRGCSSSVRSLLSILQSLLTSFWFFSNRAFIAHAMPSFLSQITPQDAVDYVIPLLSRLAIDDEEVVKEALAAELVNIIWWFLISCRVIEDVYTTSEDSCGPSTYATALSTPNFLLEEPKWATPSETLISVQAFTPILGTLLLSPNGTIGGSARGAVVELLQRIKLADEKENILAPGTSPEATSHRFPTDEAEKEFSVGLFQKKERNLFEHELLYQVVIGMGRLDMPQLEADENKSTPGGIERWRKSPLLSPNLQLPSEKGDSYFLQVPYKSPPRSPSPANFPAAGGNHMGAELDSAADLGSEAITDSQSLGSETSTPELSPGDSEVSTSSLSDSGSVYQFLPEVLQTSRVDSDDQDEWLSQKPEAKAPFVSPRHTEMSSDNSPLDDEERRRWVYGFNDQQVHHSEVHDVGYEGGKILDHVGEDDDGEQAAVGRLSSMSLMAAVAASSK
jgi:serine/threonine-protein phosphatase 4 regulatory subunit 1